MVKEDSHLHERAHSQAHGSPHPRRLLPRSLSGSGSLSASLIRIHALGYGALK
jgi:hypothetical protein